MAFQLPSNLFTSNRLTEEAEFVYRLSGKFRAALLAGSDAPLPTNLPEPATPPVQAAQQLARCLSGIQGHFVRLDESNKLLQALIAHIAQRAQQSPDGCIAAVLLGPYTQYTAQHGINCALLAARMADNLGLPQDDKTILIGAALTMNLGSADVQNQLAEQNGPPTTLQKQTLDIHPLLSSAMLREAGIDESRWHEAVILHHERRDGRGYPFGAKEEDIPPLAQLLHLIDIVTAKLMPRTYRPRITPKAALSTLYAGAAEPFEAAHITQLVKILGIYPPGSFVELENGERALVIKNGRSATAPLAVPIRAPNESIDTSRPGYHVKSSVSMRIEARHLPLFSQYWS
ncbi:MAG: HD domain-containing protein [Paludibacterium sp.]|uniref:HD-GYP domain-containing protein n=1 Tax=Paludibacterium sp. TaxID=1917523 RepID=UPI0025DCE680|nr:HD domain-containing phosphohydrolase [Paludibacterium sp.]MBV8046324.1 HD domain-containing protein [Paludibacterium sp.]MBV8649560.1 HD domain-containing protein [Paludibacterium sp.]